jgi:hypothetical protein
LDLLILDLNFSKKVESKSHSNLQATI